MKNLLKSFCYLSFLLSCGNNSPHLKVFAPVVSTELEFMPQGENGIFSIKINLKTHEGDSIDDSKKIITFTIFDSQDREVLFSGDFYVGSHLEKDDPIGSSITDWNEKWQPYLRGPLVDEGIVLFDKKNWAINNQSFYSYFLEEDRQQLNANPDSSKILDFVFSFVDENGYKRENQISIPQMFKYAVDDDSFSKTCQDSTNCDFTRNFLLIGGLMGTSNLSLLKSKTIPCFPGQSYYLDRFQHSTISEVSNGQHWIKINKKSQSWSDSLASILGAQYDWSQNYGSNCEHFIDEYFIQKGYTSQIIKQFKVALESGHHQAVLQPTVLESF